jgi:hypothetical protein
MKKFLMFCTLALVISSCSYTVYDMNKGELKIAKKDSYLVHYSTTVPSGTSAKIVYTDLDNANVEIDNVSGKWEKSIDLRSGQDVVFKVDVKLPQTTPRPQLVTVITVDGEKVSEETQSGKNANYRFGFKLP